MIIFRSNAVHAIEKLIDQHSEELRLEPNAMRSTQVWHMLVSLREFCVYNELSFDDILASVKEHEAECSGEGA